MSSFRSAQASAVFAALALGGGVATAQPVPGKSLLYADECRLGTESSDSQRYHALLYYPHEYAMRVPGLVIGAEKSGTDQVRRGAQAVGLQPAPDGIAVKDRTTRWLKDVMQGGSKAVFISHVAAFDGQAGSLVFDAYRSPAQPDDTRLDPALKNVPWLDCQREPVPRANAYADSWRGVKAARERMASDLAHGRYTHVVMIAMGWNTVQTEAMQNFASITRNLQAAAPDKANFRPYIIGFTWPSQWDNPFLGSVLVRPSSLLNKANDADEFAAGWLSASIRYAVLPALAETAVRGQRPKLIAIGHSFGARALSHAICRGTVLKPGEGGLNDPPLAAGAVDALISLQGAYSLNRLRASGAGPSSLAYAPGCPAAARLVFTASRHDSAAEGAAKIPGPLWAGSMKSWLRLQQDGSHLDDGSRMTLCTAQADGQLGQGCDLTPQTRMLYVNASELIKYQSFGTGGGAHSDIYRPETGRFLWNVLRPSP
ncbi:MAG: alpha/beta hydrolase [Ideonella sp.]|nr:alpha/beta hydrolase [Ideonella sp.]